ncbi:hypothetical protein ABG849_24165, partial [Phocaeicola vulgatus]
KVIILILWWRNFQLEYWRTFQLVSTGITRACYYKWRDSDLKFKERAEEVEEETIDVVESKLLSAINNDDLTAIIFYLKTKGKKRGYVERVEQDVNVNPFESLIKELPDKIEE